MTFRWAGNEFALRLPVCPGRANAIVLRMYTQSLSSTIRSLPSTSSTPIVRAR